jgi:hypothetical protein
MTHEPFLLKAMNELTLDFLVLLFKNMKAASVIFFGCVSLLIVWCCKKSKKT